MLFLEQLNSILFLKNDLFAMPTNDVRQLKRRFNVLFNFDVWSRTFKIAQNVIAEFVSLNAFNAVPISS
jgi:hypothetical protein